MQSKAATVREYLAELPADRRAALETVRSVILANIDANVEEGMQYGMIGYYIPHRVFPDGYHCDPRQPLPFIALASQKNYMSLYLMAIYGLQTEESWLRAEWARAGKKLDMGKCCIRFKKLEDLPLDAVAQAIRRVPSQRYIEHYVSLLGSRDGAGSAASRKPGAGSSAPKGKAAGSKVTRSAGSKSTRAAINTAAQAGSSRPAAASRPAAGKSKTATARVAAAKKPTATKKPASGRKATGSRPALRRGTR